MPSRFDEATRLHSETEGALRKKGRQPACCSNPGEYANVIGAFDLGVSFLTEASADLRKQARIGNLARALFAQAWAEKETGDWVGAMREAEESARFAEETGAALWTAAATIVKAKIAGMQGDLKRSEALAAQAERLIFQLAPVSCWRCCSWQEA